MLHILQSSAKKKILSCYHTTSQNVRRQSTIEILKRKEHFKRSDIKKTRSTKSWKYFTVIKNYIQNKMTRISQ